MGVRVYVEVGDWVGVGVGVFGVRASITLNEKQHTINIAPMMDNKDHFFCCFTFIMSPSCINMLLTELELIVLLERTYYYNKGGENAKDLLCRSVWDDISVGVFEAVFYEYLDGEGFGLIGVGIEVETGDLLVDFVDGSPQSPLKRFGQG